ncbi:MAG TPA: pyridine nucleotide-disulfide oxidoreductase [Lentisphaeria bacterium]|nr:MAG: hypothetical protein A2X47_02850 [Lentisphaerae bacterium GWF2_38_69]HBM15378.1 pyridine nucleotide-disulfide oxidoreductase [Lentisphaeria bacterium]
MKLIIIGGVAGGASAAARARRNSENAEIILFEKGEYVSFANCGLPYHIGNVIEDRDDLLVMTPESFKERANIEVRIKSEITAVNTKEKSITVKDHLTAKIYTETYDKLILSPGSSPFIPPIPGTDDPDICVLWTIPDMDKIISKIKDGAKNAIVVGGGFIGLEVAENLIQRGITTTLIEKMPNLLVPFDVEMGAPLTDEMASHGVKLLLNNGITKVEKTLDKKFIVSTDTGHKIATDLLILSIGIRPNTAFLKNSGIKLNAIGAIVTDKYLCTSDPDIYAVGDAIEVNDLILSKQGMIPLAGPANKQGRIASDNAMGSRKEYKGSLGTAICKVFSLSAACAGLNEKKLKQAGIDYIKYYILPQSNASYFPGSERMYIKMIIARDGRILGSQIVGGKGVDKKIDLIATAMRNGLKVTDLSELELSYAPPYNSAKDPINFAGFVGEDILEGKSQIVHSDNITKELCLIDVREKDEVEMGTIPNSVNIPLGQIRSRLSELPKDKTIVTFCKVGLRGYLAERILKENGFDSRNLSGGFEVWKLFNTIKKTVPDSIQPTTQNLRQENNNMNVNIEINACGLQCPGPIIKVKDAINKIKEGEILKIRVNDRGFLNDIPAWCHATGNELISLEQEDKNGVTTVLIRKGSHSPKIDHPSCSVQEKKTAIVLFSNDLDKAMAAFIMASGFASLGHKVSIFFTFWGLNVLRKENPPAVKKDFLSKMFGIMMPRGAKKLALSKMHMMGIGTAMMKHVIKSKNINSLPELISQAQCMGVEFIACDMAMNVMGLKEEELISGIKIAGVGNFAALSEQSAATLFI